MIHINLDFTFSAWWLVIPALLIAAWIGYAIAMGGDNDY